MTKWLREIAVATVVENAGEGRANSPVVGQLRVIQLPVCRRSGQNGALQPGGSFRARGLGDAGSHTLQ
jgi:hypothetical protein